MALAFVFAPHVPVFLPYGALLNATFSLVATSSVTGHDFTLHNLHFVFFDLSATQLAVHNTIVLGFPPPPWRPRWRWSSATSPAAA